MLRKTKRLFPLLGIVVLSFLLLMGSVSATILFERYNTNDDNDNTIGGASWLAQTFTVGNTGFNQTHNITGVRLKVGNWDGFPGNFTVGIRATDPVTHKPTGADLTNVTVNVNTIPLISAWCWFNFTSPYQLLKGITYAIVCRIDDIGSATWRQDITASSYAGGHGVYSATSGVTWGALLPVDYMFEEYGAVIISAEATLLPLDGQLYGSGSIPLPVDLSVHEWSNSTNFITSTIKVYYYDNVGFVWSLAQQYINTNVPITSAGVWHNETFVPAFSGFYGWYVNITTYGVPEYFPNGAVYNWTGDTGASAETDFVNMFEYFLLPEASPVSPANNSYIPTNTANLAVRVWDNDSATPIAVTFYVYRNNSGVWSLDYIQPGNSPLSGGISYFNLSVACYSGDVRWHAKVVSDGDTVYTVNWTFYTHNNTFPVAVITSPVNGTVYTSFQWMKAHALTLTTSDAEGDLVSIYMQIKNKYGTMAQCYALTDVVNGTYTIDLMPWVVFDNMTYDITLFSQDNVACMNGTYSNVTFTIGTPNTKTHLSVKDCYPPDGDDNAIGAINTGITFDAITNITEEAPTIWLFLIDMDKTQESINGYLFNPVIAVGSRYCNFFYPESKELWHHFSLGKGFLQVRHTYKVYVGIFSSGNPPGKTTVGVSPASRIEADFIYDLSARPMSFSYEFANFDIPKEYEIMEDLSSGDAHFVGVTWEFSTYPAGESPSTGDIGDMTTGGDFSKTLFKHATSDQAAFFGLIAGFVIVAAFSIIPYLLIKKKYAGRNTAMPINITFTAFGLVTAYSMGFLPLWIFVPPVFIIMVILVYKITVWITSRKQLIGGEEGGA